MTAELSPSVRERIDTIERGYEFFLAYAAQVLKGDRGSRSGGEMRSHLRAISRAVRGLADALRESIRLNSGQNRQAWRGLLEIIEQDALATTAALEVVSAQPSVSSQLIDNLNANVHFRALLTGLFLVDEIIEPVIPE